MTSKRSRRAALFEPGLVVATPGALTALAAAGQNAVHFLARHLGGDWGDVDAADGQVNDHALTHHGRLLSVYAISTGERVWIITEWDRSTATLLLPDEY
ncbi:MAG: hypothetical protein M3R24_21980 [Chloroflexota bacterium]|nr:hypothetical protein [Chloroflexota bacterium]